MFADYVIKSRNVFTGDGSMPFAGGVAIAGDKIVTCGNELHLAPFVGPQTVVRDYGDRLVMPGLIDSHTHFAQGSMTSDEDFCVNLIDCTSFGQCMERVVGFAESHPDNEWILGTQVIQFQWDVPEMPTAAMIDRYLADRLAAGRHAYRKRKHACDEEGRHHARHPRPPGGKDLARRGRRGNGRLL